MSLKLLLVKLTNQLFSDIYNKNKIEVFNCKRRKKNIFINKMMSTKQHTLFCATILVVFIVQWTIAASLEKVRSA